MVELRRRAKLGSNRSNRGRDMAIFRFFQDGGCPQSSSCCQAADETWRHAYFLSSRNVIRRVERQQRRTQCRRTDPVTIKARISQQFIFDVQISKQRTRNSSAGLRVVHVLHDSGRRYKSVLYSRKFRCVTDFTQAIVAASLSISSQFSAAVALQLALISLACDSCLMLDYMCAL